MNGLVTMTLDSSSFSVIKFSNAFYASVSQAEVFCCYIRGLTQCVRGVAPYSGAVRWSVHAPSPKGKPLLGVSRRLVGVSSCVVGSWWSQLRLPLDTSTMTDDAYKIDREHARICRRRDKHWGWAFAYFIPYCGVYHLITRKTLTPLFTMWTGCFLAVLLGLGFEAVAGKKDKQGTAVALAILATFPGAVKAGIEWDCVRAEKELEAKK